MAGIFVAKSISDDRLIDLPVSAVMWDLLLGKKPNLFDLKKIDKTMFELFLDLQVMANRKKEIDEMVLDPEMRSRLVSQVKSLVSEIGLFFRKGHIKLKILVWPSTTQLMIRLS